MAPEDFFFTRKSRHQSTQDLIYIVPTHIFSTCAVPYLELLPTGECQDCRGGEDPNVAAYYPNNYPNNYPNSYPNSYPNNYPNGYPNSCSGAKAQNTNKAFKLKAPISFFFSIKKRENRRGVCSSGAFNPGSSLRPAPTQWGAPSHISGCAPSSISVGLPVRSTG